MKVNYKKKLAIFTVCFIALLVLTAGLVAFVDPYFHYHKPFTQIFYYNLENERSQNYGIIRHFGYDAMITGTSMTENFNTSDFDEIFDAQSIKVPFAGAGYKEINDNIEVALRYNPNLTLVVRGLDMSHFFYDKDYERVDMGEYPTYLYDENIFTDVKYVYNKDMIFTKVMDMGKMAISPQVPAGMTSFDDYKNWMAEYTFGRNTLRPDGIVAPNYGEPVHMSELDREIVRGTINQNLTPLAKEYPDVTFYYFFTPYSVLWWENLVDDGTIYRQLEAEQMVIEELLKYDNIKLYSFNNFYDITTDLNNYKDSIHYGSWINRLMLYYMKSEKGLLTKDNYEDYLQDELSTYLNFDYDGLNEQEDYDNDYMPMILLDERGWD